MTLSPVLPVVCVGGRPANIPLRAAALKAAGFQAAFCRTIPECEQLLANAAGATVIMGPDLGSSERVSLARRLKKMQPPAIVVMLHEGSIEQTEQADAVIQAADHAGLIEALVYLRGER